MTFRAADVFGDYPAGKEPLEVTYVRGVLERAGFMVRSVRSQDKPDVVAELTNGTMSLVLGCEVGLVYADATASGSPLRRFWNMWLRIARDVQEQLSTQHHSVPYCAVHFRSGSNTVDLRDHRGIVRELVLVGQRLEMDDEVLVDDQYPALCGIISGVNVVDRDGRGRFWWPSHLQAGPVHAPDGHAGQLFIEKCNQARAYNWCGIERKWLLLVAEGRGTTDLFGQARPIPLPSAHVVPFDEVVVWDRFSEDVWLVFPDFKVLADGQRKLRHVEALSEPLRQYVSRNDRYDTTERRHRPG